MSPDRKRLFGNNIKRTRKKRKMEADSHVGESSDGSFGLNFFLFGCCSKELPQCWAVDDDVSERSDGSFALDLCVSGFRSEEGAHHFQQMIRQIIQSVNNAYPAPRNLALKTGSGIQETATVRDLQTTFRKDYELTGDASVLQVDVLVRIAENHLLSAGDFVMFSSVCRSWYRAAAACNLVKLKEKWAHCQMPWIMLTDGNTGIDEDGYSKSDYGLPLVLNDIEEYDADVEFSTEARSGPKNLYTRCVLDLRWNKSFNIECPEGYGRVCWGSAHGWIVTAGGDGKMFMFNPLTKSRVSLPSFSTFRHRWDHEDKIRRNYFVTRAVVLRVGADDYLQSCGDSVENLRVVTFYGDDHVAIVKPGNRRWVEIEGAVRTISRLMDVVYDSSIGLVFVDDCMGLLSCILPENEEESPSLKWIKPPSMGLHRLKKTEFYVGAYVFKCGADLVMVLRLVDYVGNRRGNWIDFYHSWSHRSDTYKTTWFDVFKFNFRVKDWVKINDLKDVSLFVGNNASMWVDAPSAGCERNCIYYTDDTRIAYRLGKDKLGGHDSGIRKMSDPPMDSHSNRWSQPLPVPEGSNTRSSYCCPLWFRPSVCLPKDLN